MGKQKPNPREMRFFEEMMKNPYADINDLITGGVTPTPSAINQSPTESTTQLPTSGYQLAGYDKYGNPLYRGPDGKLYRKQ